MTEYKVSFQEGNNVTEIKLYSKFTCIHGKNSGEGKTEFFTYVENGINDGTMTINTDLPFTLATAATLDAILNNTTRMIIMIDEVAMLNSKLVKRVNQSHHLFIGISRGVPLRCDYPLKGIYKIERTETFFAIKPADGLRITNSPSKIDKIITEAEPGHSEHQLISQYFPTVIGAAGRDKIERKLRGIKGHVLVVADLGNIGKPYHILAKRCKDNENIVFYDYLAFEQLLYESNLLSDLRMSTADIFSYISLERYYEDTVEQMTKGSIFEYEHGKPLAAPYLNNENFNAIFNNEVGRGLYIFCCLIYLAQVFRYDNFTKTLFALAV